MIWCDSRKFVFYSFPKTASESVRTALAPYGERRIGVLRRWRASPPLYPHIAPRAIQPPLGYFRLTIIRHPYARLRSLYAMICRNNKKWRIFGAPLFEHWLETLHPENPKVNGPNHQGWRQYGSCSAYYWTHDDYGALLVDEVVKLEELAIKWPEILTQLDLPDVHLPLINRTLQPPPTLTQRAKDIIAHKYSRDFEVFNYAI